MVSKEIPEKKEEVKQELVKQKGAKSALKTKFLSLRNRMRSKVNRIDQSVNKFTYNLKENHKELAFYGIVYGALINYMLFVIFHIPFYWYGFPAYGIALYLIKSEFMEIWTDIWFRSDR